jgi:tetratricopeptide (TPR) repeat protein
MSYRKVLSYFLGVCLAAPCLASSVSGNAAGSEVRQGALEVTSGLGRKLYALPDDSAVVTARANLQRDPRNVKLVLLLSKAQAGRRQYREAIVTCTKGLAFAPNNAELFVERGHRELGLREFRAAMADLQRAESLDPRNLDARYHLGLSHYFVGEFDGAAHAFRNALILARNNDSVIDCSNWLYVSLRRAGKEEEAALVLKKITPEMKNTEPHLYFYLRLLRFYQGKITEQELLPPKPASANDTEGELSFDTVNYGVGNWPLYHHQPGPAAELFKKVVTGEAWNAWGFIGSETELVRMKMASAKVSR